MHPPRILVSSLAAVLLGCMARPDTAQERPGPVAEDEESPADWAELAQERCAGVVAVWRGTREPPVGGVAPPLEYGFRQLVFRFADDRLSTFTPTGTLYFSDWQRDIFAPDCAHVVLLQDRFGPYHVVALDHLREYLAGMRGPDHVVEGCSECSSAAVHADARWLDAGTLDYELAACGSTWRARFALAQAPASCIHSAGRSRR